MQRLNLFRPTLESAFRIAAAVIKLDHLFERRRLATAEIRCGLRHLTQAFGAPQPRWNFLRAEIAIAPGRWIITENAVHAEVAAGGCGIADERLVGRASWLRRVSVRRPANIDLQPNHVKVIV